MLLMERLSVSADNIWLTYSSNINQNYLRNKIEVTFLEMFSPNNPYFVSRILLTSLEKKCPCLKYRTNDIKSEVGQYNRYVPEKIQLKAQNKVVVATPVKKWSMIY